MSASVRSTFVRLLFALALVTLAWLLLTFPAPTQAGGCAAVYTVQPGDTLSAIARANGVSVQTLAQINRLHSPYWLRAGQTLCLPLETTRGMVSLELSHEFGISPPEARVEFPISAAANGVSLYSSVDDLRNAIPSDAPVVLWLARNNNTPGYTLLVVGETISQTAVFDPLNVVAPNVDTQVSNLQRTKPELKPVAELLAWVEGAEGERLPFHIAYVRGVPTLTAAKQKQPKVYLAVAGNEVAGYRLHVVVGRDNQDNVIFGPSGEDRQVRCDRWRGRGGLIYRLLRRWYRC